MKRLLIILCAAPLLAGAASDSSKLAQAETAADSLQTMAADSVDADSLQTAVTDSAQKQPTPTWRKVLTWWKYIRPDTLMPRPIPKDGLQSLQADTSILYGAKYGSFGHILEQLPVYYLDPGGVGRRAYTTQFAGQPGRQQLDIDGLIMNDPLTGLADMNVVQVEGAGHIQLVHSPTRRSGLLTPGHAVQLETLDISNNPIRSQVTYRTGGHTYDDVDVRLGIRNAKYSAFNLGGTSKRFGGVIANGDYGAYKGHVRWDRQLTPVWTMRYVLLYYKGNGGVPFLEPLHDYPNLNRPRFNIRRTDHGLQFTSTHNLGITLQATNQRQRFHGDNYKIFNDKHRARQYRITAQGEKTVRSLRWQWNSRFIRSNFTSNTWENIHDDQWSFWTAIGNADEQRLTWQAAVRASAWNAEPIEFLPDVSLSFRPDSLWKTFIFANQSMWYPSYAERHDSGPLHYGAAVMNRNLQPQKNSNLGAGFERLGETTRIYASLAAQDRQNPILAVLRDDSVRYRNTARSRALAADLLFEWQPFADWTLHGRAAYYYRSRTAAMLPDAFARGYVQFHRYFFERNLNLTVRVGASLVGPMEIPLPMFADRAEFYSSQSLRVDPYVHGIAQIGNMTWFISFENYIGNAYYRYAPTPMPEMWLRYGFVWKFRD